MKLLKAFYGYTQSAMLWYEKFKGCLEGLGFKLNEYDLYIANKIIDGKQYTVGWYIGDTKISHVKANVVDWVIEQLEGKFGTTTKKRGNKHTFVGMDIEITEDGKVKISMKDYLEESFQAFGEDL